jgi:ankyrin repeat protein
MLYILTALIFGVLVQHACAIPSTSDGRAEFFIDAMNNNIENVQKWLEAGGDVNVASADGKTALMRASQENHPDMVSFLIASHANVNQMNAKGITAIGLLGEYILL